MAKVAHSGVKEYGILLERCCILEKENLTLHKEFEDQQKICRKKDKFIKMEVDIQKKIQNQVANLRMSVKE